MTGGSRASRAGRPRQESETSFPAAPLDRPTRLVTFAVTALLLVALPLLVLSTGEVDRTTAVVLGSAVAALLIGAWGFGPAGYEVAEGTLRIQRRAFGSREFALRGPAIKAPAELGLGMRFGGSGGVFGWAGTFWHAGVGRYHAYLTDRSRLVACETDRGLVVVSPADPQRFLRAVRKAQQ